MVNHSNEPSTDNRIASHFAIHAWRGPFPSRAAAMLTQDA